MSIAQRRASLVLLVFPGIYLLTLIVYLTRQCRTLNWLYGPTVLQESLVHARVSVSNGSRIFWESTDATKRLYVLEQPKISIGERFILREWFACWDTTRRKTVDLSLCFSPQHALTDVVVEAFESTMTPGRSQRAMQVNRTGASVLSPPPPLPLPRPDYTAFSLVDPHRARSRHPIAQLKQDHDAWTRALQKDMVELMFELLDYLQITWFVVYGSLIAVRRHLDQIPWDDDVDVLVPSYHLARLLGFFDKGQPRHQQNAAYDIAARQWWEWYVAMTPEATRQAAEQRYRSCLAFYLQGNPKHHFWFSAKIYWKDGPSDVHSKRWTFPFLDIFTYDVVVRDGEQFIQRGLGGHVIPAASVFPLRQRPLGQFMVSVPYAASQHLVAKDQSMFRQCWSGDFSHYYETSKRSYVVPCAWLYDRVPFVTERQRILLPRASLPTFPTLPFHFDPLNVTVNQQRHFEIIENRVLAAAEGSLNALAGLAENKGPSTLQVPSITEGSLVPLRLQPGSRFLQATSDFTSFQFEVLKRNGLSSYPTLRHHARHPRSDGEELIAGTYEQLTVNGVILSELIDVLPPYPEFLSMTLEAFLTEHLPSICRSPPS